MQNSKSTPRDPDAFEDTATGNRQQAPAAYSNFFLLRECRKIKTSVFHLDARTKLLFGQMGQLRSRVAHALFLSAARKTRIAQIRRRIDMMGERIQDLNGPAV